MYQRLVRRMGKKKALVAVAHRLLIIIYHLLKSKKPYQERPSAPMGEQRREKEQRRLVKKLEALGLKVTVEAVEPLQVVPDPG